MKLVRSTDKYNRLVHYSWQSVWCIMSIDRHFMIFVRQMVALSRFNLTRLRTTVTSPNESVVYSAHVPAAEELVSVYANTVKSCFICLIVLQFFFKQCSKSTNVTNAFVLLFAWSSTCVFHSSDQHFDVSLCQLHPGAGQGVRTTGWPAQRTNIHWSTTGKHSSWTSTNWQYLLQERNALSLQVRLWSRVHEYIAFVDIDDVIVAGAHRQLWPRPGRLPAQTRSALRVSASLVSRAPQLLGSPLSRACADASDPTGLHWTDQRPRCVTRDVSIQLLADDVSTKLLASSC